MTKEEKSLEIISKAIDRSSHPIAMCSFGKDSMVMMHLIRKVKWDIPILNLREVLWSKQYEFDNKIIDAWNLKVHTFPPTITDIIYKDGYIDGVAVYLGYNGALIYNAVELIEGSGMGCALDDIVTRPRVQSYTYLWDATFIGTKGCDTDSIFGSLGYRHPKLNFGGGSMMYPIIDWTDEDIWEYTERESIPYNDKKYDKDNNYAEFEDKSYNNNYLTCCTSCIHPDKDNIVYCKRDDNMIKNVGKYIDYKKDYNTIKSVIEEGQHGV